MDKSTQNAQNVVEMAQYFPQTGFAAVSQIDAYWEALRGDRVMPKRSEIDPRGIEAALEYAFIVERIAPGVARLRIAGSHLNDLMGMEVRGMPLSAMVAPTARRNFNETLEYVFETPAKARFDLEGQTRPGRAIQAARMILLPLESDLGDSSRLLGCLVAPGDFGEPPLRFEIAKSVVDPIGPKRDSVLPNRPILAHQGDHAPGFAEPVEGFEGTKIPPYLRLVEPDDKS